MNIFGPMLPWLFSILFLNICGAAEVKSCAMDLYTPAFTPRLNYYWSPTTFDHGAMIEAFLVAGEARFAADQKRGGTVEDHLRGLVTYVASRVAYDEACSTTPPITFSEVLQTGRGACLQQNFLTAALLSRLGFKTRLVLREPADGWGHLWVEVGDGIFIADAARGGFIGVLPDLRSANPDERSFEAQWYLHPDRVYHLVQ